MGRRSFPADNEIVAGKLHNYTEWWNSVSHDLAGTGFQPLNPDIPDDFKKIQIIWYDCVDQPPQGWVRH